MPFFPRHSRRQETLAFPTWQCVNPYQKAQNRYRRRDSAMSPRLSALVVQASVFSAHSLRILPIPPRSMKTPEAPQALRRLFGWRLRAADRIVWLPGVVGPAQPLWLTLTRATASSLAHPRFSAWLLRA